MKLSVFESLKQRFAQEDPSLGSVTPQQWEEAGYDIPTVEGKNDFTRMTAAVALHKQGLPCYYKWKGELRFSGVDFVKAYDPEDVAEDQRQIAEMDYWTKYPNRLKSAADMIKTPAIEWLVQDRVHKSGLFQLFGASYTGKTLLVLDLVMSWCAGLPEWQGYQLNNEGEPQDALYVAAEGGAALSVHVDAWLKHHPEVHQSDLSGLVFLDGGDGDSVFLSIDAKRRRDDEPDIQHADSWDRLFAEVLDKGLSPTLVVFDTQIDLAPGVDENSNTDMVGVLRKVKRLGDTYGFMAIVVHHTGHDGNKARGASGMMGKCDAQAKLSSIGEKSGKAKLEWIKVKGGPAPQDTISYEISGSAKLPDLDSEGAVCVPISKFSAAHAELAVKTPSEETQRLIMNALNGGQLSTRALSEAVGIDRNAKVFKDALEWMTASNHLSQTQKGRSTMVGLHPLAMAPTDPTIG
ncbi:AAA family ATPase [Arthrobacter sp. NPDC080031]|uniref:AAA family ATPase n=1 Tax=Arthrobacter sp. NPDC080031 TaxID=3155918 RepID=UPI00344D64F0